MFKILWPEPEKPSKQNLEFEYIIKYQNRKFNEIKEVLRNRNLSNFYESIDQYLSQDKIKKGYIVAVVAGIKEYPNCKVLTLMDSECIYRATLNKENSGPLKAAYELILEGLILAFELQKKQKSQDYNFNIQINKLETTES